MSDKRDRGANADKDAIDTLPLSSIPLASKTLKGAKLVKNSRMETAVEILSDPLTGSLQVNPDAIGEFMHASAEDQAIINSLAGLNSFDVYSLRSNLKRLGVEVQDAEALELSDDIKDRLSMYNLDFIRPLIEKIFGTGREDLAGASLTKILSHSDPATVRENLAVIAQKTGIPLDDIPKFLAEYSDVFISVAYYRYSFENIGQELDRFLVWIDEVKKMRDVASSPRMSAQCKLVEEVARFLAKSIRERLVLFQRSFEDFWRNINRESFLQLRRQIEENHGTMGAVLCGLVVKMTAWKNEFPNNAAGGPATRAKFIVTEMEPGISYLRDLEIDARHRLGLKQL